MEEIIATAARPEPEEERQRANEISELWAVHVQARSVVRKTKEQIEGNRERLSQRLFEMKQLLARPGRSGQWSAWLKERGICRATADRLVQRYAAALPWLESLHESISSPPTDTVERLAEVLCSRFKRVLATGEAVVQFLSSVAQISGVPHEWRHEGLMVFRAVPEAGDELPGTASATDPDPHPSDEASAVKEAAEGRDGSRGDRAGCR